MNDLQKEFLKGGLALIHCDTTIEKVYNKDDIYADKSKFKELIKGCKRLDEINQDLEEIGLQQFNYSKPDLLIIVAKLLDKVIVSYDDSKIEYKAKKSLVKNKNNICFNLINIDYSKNIKSIKLIFQMDIIDSLEIKVKTIKAKKVVEEIKIPGIDTIYSLGESLINIKYKNIPDVYDVIEVHLLDSQNDLLGIFKPKEGINFVSINDLAFDKYYYEIIIKKNNEIIAKSDKKMFELKRPNYSGKPVR